VGIKLPTITGLTVDIRRLRYIYYVKSYSKYNTKKLKKEKIKLRNLVYISVLRLTTFRHH